jgi:hypothetical protein
MAWRQIIAVVGDSLSHGSKKNIKAFKNFIYFAPQMDHQKYSKELPFLVILTRFTQHHHHHPYNSFKRVSKPCSLL